MEGEFWLGDYGSSQKLDELNSFRGGTIMYHIQEISHERPADFDRAGLCLSILELLGVMKLHRLGNTMTSVMAALNEVSELDALLGEKLRSLVASF